MLRIHVNEHSSGTTIRIEGRLVREFAEDFRIRQTFSKFPARLLVDLSDVIFVDDIGEEVLSWFKSVGVKFIANSAYSLDVCKRLCLPVVSKRIESSSPV